jgi:hypothetical protein
MRDRVNNKGVGMKKVKVNNGRKYWIGRIEKINGKFKVECNGIKKQELWTCDNLDEVIILIKGSDEAHMLNYILERIDYGWAGK